MSISSAVDRVISVISPRWALSRTTARMLYQRATLAEMEKYTGVSGGYEAGRLSRFTQGKTGRSQTENEVPRGQIDQMRRTSWECYRNNPHARKAVRALESRTLGRDPHPSSQAVTPDGEPFLEWRKRAEALWRAASEAIDYRGAPGAGGSTYADQARVALKQTILSGEVLYRFVIPRDARLPKGRDRFNTPPPLRLQMIHADRLDDSLQANDANGNEIFYGIELDAQQNRAGYWIRPPALRSTFSAGSQRYDAADIRHLFVPEDVDQLRGVPWFAASLFKFGDIHDYEFYELQAAKMAACIALGFRKSPGQTFGLEPPTGWNVTDLEGNAITNLQPGMLVDLGPTGEIDAFNPSRPNVNAVEFLQHELRTAAGSMPGLKGSILTGDYRGSSFASERAAENETWPEIEIIQDWFGLSFQQPIYERIIRLGVLSGWFDGVEGFSIDDFVARPRDYLHAEWQGPTPKSINPTDDAEAATARVRAGISSVIAEAAKVGTDVRKVLEENAQFIEQARERGMSEDWINGALGITQQDTAKDEEEDDDEGKATSGASRPKLAATGT